MGAMEPTLQSSFSRIVVGGHRQEQSIIRPAAAAQTTIHHKRVMVSAHTPLFFHIFHSSASFSHC